MRYWLVRFTAASLCHPVDGGAGLLHCGFALVEQVPQHMDVDPLSSAGLRQKTPHQESELEAEKEEGDER